VEIITYDYDENGNITGQVNWIYEVEEDRTQNLVGKEVVSFEYRDGLLINETKETFLVTSSGNEILLGKKTIENEYENGNLIAQTIKLYEQVEIEEGEQEVLLVSAEVSAFEYRDGLLTTQTIDRYSVDQDGTESLIETEVIINEYDGQGRLITEINQTYWIDMDGEKSLVAIVETTNQYDENGNLVHQLQERSALIDGNEILVGKKEVDNEYDADGNLTTKTITTYDIKDEEDAGFEKLIEEYDAEGRVIYQEIAEYEITAMGGEILLDKRVKKNFQYDIEHPDLLLSFTIEDFEVDEYGDEALVETKTVTLEEIDILLKEDELAQNDVTEAEQNVSSLYNSVNSTRLLQEEITALSDSIPYDLEVSVITSRSNMQYNDAGQLTDYVDVTIQNGMTNESVWKVLDRVSDIERWARGLYEETRDRAIELYNEAAIAEAEGRDEDAQLLREEAGRLRQEVDGLEEIVHLARSATQKADNLRNAVKAGDQDLIETSQAELLEAQDALGDRVEDFVRAREDELDLINDRVEQLEILAREARNIANNAQEIADKANADARDAEKRAAQSQDPDDIAEAERLRGFANQAQELKAPNIDHLPDLIRGEHGHGVLFFCTVKHA